MLAKNLPCSFTWKSLKSKRIQIFNSCFFRFFFLACFSFFYFSEFWHHYVEIYPDSKNTYSFSWFFDLFFFLFHSPLNVFSYFTATKLKSPKTRKLRIPSSASYSQFLFLPVWLIFYKFVSYFSASRWKSLSIRIIQSHLSSSSSGFLLFFCLAFIHLLISFCIDSRWKCLKNRILCSHISFLHVLLTFRLAFTSSNLFLILLWI